jgi:DNA-binding NtrC family response regulator
VTAPLLDNCPRILLLVDDEPRLLSSLYELLRDRDYHLVTATCGSEALAQLTRLQFDLILLDLRLPDMSGHEIMDFINDKGIDGDVIVMSGDVGIDSAIGALKRGAYDYLRKPYSREELLKTVDNALQKRRLESTTSASPPAGELREDVPLPGRQLARHHLHAEPRRPFTFVNDRVQQLLGFTAKN